MHIAAFELVSPDQRYTAFPIRMHQTFPRIGPAVTLVLLLALGIVLLVPFVTLLVSAADSAEARSGLVDHPGTLAQLLLGLATWAILLGWPIKRLAGRLRQERHVEIDRAKARVVDRGLLGTRTWAAPLASYRGIAHHIRTNVSGTRHEIILVHPAREKCILLAVADRFSEEDVARICQLFLMPEVPARDLYRLRAKPAAAGPAPNTIEPADVALAA